MFLVGQERQASYRKRYLVRERKPPRVASRPFADVRDARIFALVEPVATAPEVAAEGDVVGAAVGEVNGRPAVGAGALAEEANAREASG